MATNNNGQETLATLASSENASAACAETSTEVSELVSDSTEDADMLIRLSISRLLRIMGIDH